MASIFWIHCGIAQAKTVSLTQRVEMQNWHFQRSWPYFPNMYPQTGEWWIREAYPLKQMRESLLIEVTWNQDWVSFSCNRKRSLFLLLPELLTCTHTHTHITGRMVHSFMKVWEVISTNYPKLELAFV